MASVDCRTVLRTELQTGQTPHALLAFPPAPRDRWQLFLAPQPAIQKSRIVITAQGPGRVAVSSGTLLAARLHLFDVRVLPWLAGASAGWHDA